MKKAADDREQQMYSWSIPGAKNMVWVEKSMKRNIPTLLKWDTSRKKNMNVGQ